MIFESPVPLATRDTFPTTPRRAKELLHLSVKGVDGRYAESQVRVEWDGMGWGEMALDVTTRYNGQTVVLRNHRYRDGVVQVMFFGSLWLLENRFNKFRYYNLNVTPSLFIEQVPVPRVAEPCPTCRAVCAKAHCIVGGR